MVEILTVVGIIAILVAVLIPALTVVRRIAKETQQKAQLTAIDLALVSFKSDYGSYPPSSWQWGKEDYSGAQMLSEALLGWDLMGFHPESAWRADGYDASGGPLTYDPGQVRDKNNDNILDTFTERKELYIELGSANAFRLRKTSEHDGLFDDTKLLDEDTFVICDTFGVRKVQIAAGRTVRAGTPILYYRANTSRKNMDNYDYDQRIYNVYDNDHLVRLRSVTRDGRVGDPHPLGASLDVLYYYDYNGGISDSKVTRTLWPHRPDSYILISAGADGLYGTSDDICNF